MLTLTDPENNQTTWSYDPLNRVTMETNELNDSRSFLYDGMSHLVHKTDRNDGVAGDILSQTNLTASGKLHRQDAPSDDD